MPRVRLRSCLLVALTTVFLPACAPSLTGMPVTPGSGDGAVSPKPTAGPPGPGTALTLGSLRPVKVNVVLPAATFARLRAKAHMRVQHQPSAPDFRLAYVSGDALKGAADRLKALSLIKEFAPGDLGLGNGISRAELATLVVRSFGQEQTAALLIGAATFPDTAAHWASGNIAMAKALVDRNGGDPIGMPDGSFDPDGQLTVLDTLAFLMKVAGIRPDATKAWPANHLDVAVAKGLLGTAELGSLDRVAPASRGMAYYLLDKVFSAPIQPGGRSLYQIYTDGIAPSLTVDPHASETHDETVTLSGKVSDHTSLHVGGTALVAGAGGTWRTTVPLVEGKNTFPVRATDLVGNVSEATITIARVPAKVEEPVVGSDGESEPKPVEVRPEVASTPASTETVEMAAVAAALEFLPVSYFSRPEASDGRLFSMFEEGQRTTSGDVVLTLTVLVDAASHDAMAGGSASPPALKVTDSDNNLLLAAPLVSLSGAVSVDKLSTGFSLLVQHAERQGIKLDSALMTPESLLLVSQQVESALVSSATESLDKSGSLMKLLTALVDRLREGTALTPEVLTAVQREAGIGASTGGGGSSSGGGPNG